MQISSAVTALAEGAKRSGRLANHDRILSAGKTQIDMEGWLPRRHHAPTPYKHRGWPIHPHLPSPLVELVLFATSTQRAGYVLLPLIVDMQNAYILFTVSSRSLRLR